MQYLRFRHWHNFKAYLECPKGHEALPLGQYIYIKLKYVLGPIFIKRGLPKLSFKGIYFWADIKTPSKTYEKAVRYYIFPNPLLFLWGARVAIPSKMTDFFFDIYDPDLPWEETPIDVSESVIENSQRIKFLTGTQLEFIEKRNDSILYKDPKDGRFWQSWKKKLVHVTTQQWSFEFLETRDRPNHPERDKEFFELLEENPWGQLCDESGCNNLRIKYGSLCPEHHFEVIKGRPFSEST